MKKPLTEFADLTRLLQPMLRSSKAVSSAAPALVETLARWFDCSWGSYWKADFHSAALRVVGTWMADPKLLTPMFRDAENRVLTLGEGMPGNVWRLGRPVYSGDLVRDMCLPRSLIARAANLSAGIWFPVRRERDIYAIIELLGQDLWADDQQILNQLGILGNSIAEMLPEQKQQRQKGLG
jgi:hypothetical protein